MDALPLNRVHVSRIYVTVQAGLRIYCADPFCTISRWLPRDCLANVRQHLAGRWKAERLRTDSTKKMDINCKIQRT